MGMHVISQADIGSVSTCECVARSRRPDRRMSLPSTEDFPNIEIEHAHTPVPSWRSSGGSPTGEVAARSPRVREHSEGGFVTLKRKGATDIGRASHARSSSVGSIATRCSGVCHDGAITPRTVGLGSLEALKDVRANAHVVPPLCSSTGGGCSPIPFRRVDSRSRRAGNWGGGHAGGGIKSCSSAEAAQRIAVDPDSGHSYFVERPTVCDACPYCDDVCEVAWCSGCDERRAQLERSYGSLLESPGCVGKQQPGEADEGCSCNGSSSTTSPSGIGYWGHRGEDEDSEDVDNARRQNGTMSQTPSLSRRHPRKTSYTLCEVRRRKLTGACWVVCQGLVYDVTAALTDHPGGKRSVLRNAGGRDCEEDFLFHSKAAKKQWRQYRIGHLVDCVDGGGDGSRTARMSSSDCVIS